ncbi:lysozyme C-like [Engraulis encrasicolus]|uniref:lysozyme C-like n=1 Tax=Engraulis encrasicolus TaxID=184585 RepID=UPI002FD61EAD
MRGLVFLVLVTAASAKVFTRCELARILKFAGMDGFHGAKLADWVCLTKWEADYDTQKVNRLKDGSTDYGIFQLNSKWWCSDGKTKTKNACNINCSALMSDNIQASIACAKHVMLDHNRLHAWAEWRHHCMGQNLTKYISGCF